MRRTRITPYFSVTTMFFAVAMALLAAIAWDQLGLTLPAVLSSAVALVAAVVALVFPHQPLLSRRVGFVLGLVGALLSIPAFLEAIMSMGPRTLPNATMTATMTSMGAICTVYAVFAAVAMRRDHRLAELPG